MKKLTLAALFVFCVILTVSSCSYAENDSLKIASVSGKVLVKIGDSGEWADAKAGQMLHAKDSINTQMDGSAVLEFSDKSSVALKPNTKMTIDELIWSDAARKVGVNMTSGEMRAMLKKFDKPSEFKVKTPTAICGARGTVFYVVVFADGTGVYVEDGLIDFLNTISGESYTVYKGNRSEARQDGTTTAPQQLSKAEVDKILSEWDTVVVPEPYTEPDIRRDPRDTQAPEAIQEGTASQT